MSKNSLQTLIRSARKAQQRPIDAASEEAPLGFATRVASQWANSKPQYSWLVAFEQVGWWVAGVSAAVCLAAFVHQRTMAEATAFDVFLGIESVSTVEQ